MAFSKAFTNKIKYANIYQEVIPQKEVIMKKRIIALLLAVLMTALLIPAAADPDYTVPTDYDEHDYRKLISFLEQTDEDGIKNGDKVSPNYDPNDPDTLGHVTWTESVPKKLYYVGYYYNIVDVTDKLVGDLDLSDCESLVTVRCSRNYLSSINLSGCSSLEYLACGMNEIENLNLSGCSSLVLLWCRNNYLLELDLSEFADLDFVDCIGNFLTDIDLSANPYLPLDAVHSSGNGYVGFASYLSNSEPMIPVDQTPGELIGSAVVASPEEGETFIGWYNELNELLSTETTLIFSTESAVEVTAVFTQNGTVVTPEPTDIPEPTDTPEPTEIPEPTNTPEPTDIPEPTEVPEPTMGDVNGDRTVDSSDALLALRYSLSLIELNEYQLAVADVNADGLVNSQDALLILRYALGLLTEF